MYASAKEASRHYGVTAETLRQWERAGKIPCIKTEGSHRRYLIAERTLYFNKRNYIYVRVSSGKQRGDLQRQAEFLKQKYRDYEVIKDIGSGLNFKRPGFRRILEDLFLGNLGEVVISTSDRFSRFGTKEFFGYLFNRFGAKLTILDDERHEDSKDELAGDLLEIITVFTAKYHGRRRYKTEEKQENNEEIGGEENGREGL